MAPCCPAGGGGVGAGEVGAVSTSLPAMGSSSRDDKEARAERALATLTRTAFLNAASWSVCQTANLAIGVQLAPSRAALLTAMSFVMTASSTMQFFTLPLAGALSDRFGRKPLLLARQLSTSLMNCMLALRPSYALFLLARTAAMFSYHIGDTAQSAALADVSEGRQLAVSMARMRTMMGMAMLVGPAAGGRLAEYSLRLCIGLGGVIGATVRQLPTTGRAMQQRGEGKRGYGQMHKF